MSHDSYSSAKSLHDMTISPTFHSGGHIQDLCAFYEKDKLFSLDLDRSRYIEQRVNYISAWF